MANRISSNKKEREKIKHQKRVEKQKQKEERKTQGTSSFKDMIAYVDEYGRLTSTPPEEPVEKVNVEDVQIATPKKVEEEIIRKTGKVDYFNPSKGFGFIKDNNGQKYFFHISKAPDNIQEGDNVEFESEQDARGINAMNISILQK